MPDRHLDATFAALADPTRRAILTRLTLGEASVTELAKPFEMSLPGISKHLKVLQRAGLIARGRRAQWRPCRLEAGPLKDVADWVGYYRRFWTRTTGIKNNIGGGLCPELPPLRSHDFVRRKPKCCERG